MSFVNKIVLVTGGSSGIGAATAVAFAKNGAKVAIVGRNKSKLDDVAQKCSQVGHAPLVIRADLNKEEETKTIVKKTIEKFGKLDVVVNNAGISRKDSIIEEDMLKHFDEVMNVNLRVAVIITNQAAPYLIETGGNIVNVSSNLGSQPSSMISYCVSKAGLNHFTRCVSLQLALKKVRVNTVSPGPVETDILENSGLNMDWETIGTKMPLKKVSKPEEVAELILYLASDNAKSITGANFAIDNGARLL